VVVEDGAHLGDGVILGHGAVILKDAWLEEGVEVGHNSVLGKPPRAGASSRSEPAPGGPLRIGAGSVIGAGAVIHSGNTFGEDCYIGDCAAIREACTFGAGAIVGRLASVEQETTIGARVRIMTGAYITGHCLIEDDAFIAPCVVTSNDRYMNMWKDKVYVGAIIRRAAAIGAGASILAGVTIGEEAVVGLGAVVIEDVPARRIYVGAPARDVGEVREV
jgi:UDP-2-acetamido-3-amino-2,3-dideoxy-glucuronate N-acetyltransferase